MQTTGIFSTHTHVVNVENNGDSFLLLPFGDIHYGCANHATEVFDEWCAWAKQQKNALFLGMGDYFDIASTSERRLLHNHDLHESTIGTLDQLYREQAEEFLNKIVFMKGRILALVEGNHYAELKSGITSTQYMAEVFSCKYLGVTGFVRLDFRYGTCKTSIDIFAHHGRGAARLVGGSLNRVQQLSEGFHADVYLMGHDHKRSVGSHSRIYYSKSQQVKEQRQIFARTGSFLKAYVKDRPSYIADMGGSGADLGGVKITMTPRRDRSRNGRGFYVALEAGI